MSNRFSILDSYFPCGADRAFGEVVGIAVTLSRSYVYESKQIFAKRKQWYRNASVNAWHLHRALCREAKTFSAYTDVPSRQLTAVLGDIVEICYVSNYVFGHQYSAWELCAIDWPRAAKVERFTPLLLDVDGIAQDEATQVLNPKELLFWLHASAFAKSRA